jgi:hypothetical protein
VWTHLGKEIVCILFHLDFTSDVMTVSL